MRNRVFSGKPGFFPVKVYLFNDPGLADEKPGF